MATLTPMAKAKKNLAAYDKANGKWNVDTHTYEKGAKKRCS